MGRKNHSVLKKDRAEQLHVLTEFQPVLKIVEGLNGGPAGLELEEEEEGGRGAVPGKGPDRRAFQEGRDGRNPAGAHK